eukprot:Clim_evm80s215 gene=Clim_evmTU80s215
MADFQAKQKAIAGVDDMVLLSNVNEKAILENLKKRHFAKLMFCYIGPVLVAVNPFQQLPYFTDREVDQYQGIPPHENPPHIYAVADSMFRNMLIDRENQCVIISGESGAGKTVSAKFIMNYLAQVSGGGGDAQHVKSVVLESNPLLEAFGNAKTLRNNNSSRFGKYFEIGFSVAGAPNGGKINQFLLEKSRVVGVQKGERTFHIFYQLSKGASPQQREVLGVDGKMDYFRYLAQSTCYDADGIDDVKEFQDTQRAMGVMGIDDGTQMEILKIVAGILHLGNITFIEDGNNAQVADMGFLDFPAYLLGIDSQSLNAKLTTRRIETRSAGRRNSIYDSPLNVEQAGFTRDALAKAVYARMFDWLIEAVNRALGNHNFDLSIGVLDIYGFEIFDKNGFEQFCINFVNEKLQQIFIELTLKQEQEEYNREGIKWTPIDYFNNKIVCDLIEGKSPPGLSLILDDVCKTMHAQSDGADIKFVQKASMGVPNNPRFQTLNTGFVIQHYAGNVTYEADGFVEKNRDTLYKDLVELMQMSQSTFIRNLFPDVLDDDKKTKITFGTKIRRQANELVETLMKAQPSYIRCIKPNDTLKPGDFEDRRVSHQIKYLGLKENIRVRRAGFAYRPFFDKFLRRYAILSNRTFPYWTGDPIEGCKIILTAANMDPAEWQIGKTKLFVKSPESLFMLEELRERKYNGYAKKIQRAWRRWNNEKYYLELRQKALTVLGGRKQRHRNTINRFFVSDYIGYMDNKVLQSFVGKKERVGFADKVTLYDKKFQTSKADLMIGERIVYIVGLEKAKEGPNKGKLQRVLKHKLACTGIASIDISTRPDGFILIHPVNPDPKHPVYDILLESVFKTEFLVVLTEVFQKALQRNPPLNFTDNMEMSVKKKLLDRSGKRAITFVAGSMPNAVVRSHGTKGATIEVADGLPADSKPTRNRRPAKERKAEDRFQGGAPPPEVNYYQQRMQQQQQQPQPHRPAAPMAAAAAAHQPPAAAHQPSPMQAKAPTGSSQDVRNDIAARVAAMGGMGRPPQQLQQQQQQQPRHHHQPAATNGGPRAVPGVTAGQGGGRLAPQQKTPNSLSPGGSPAPAKKRKPPPPVPKRRTPKVRAIYDYEAQDADELSFAAGTEIELRKEDPSGWWEGRLNGKVGLFPGNYVEKL